MNNNEFIDIFDKIYMKIPYIYGEIFLKLFGNKYRYLYIEWDKFVGICKDMFINRSKLDREDFYNNYFGNYKYSKLLSSRIDDKILLDIINNKFDDSNYYSGSNIIIDSIIVSKVLIRIIDILNIYKNGSNNFKKYIDYYVNRYRTWEMDLKYIGDVYYYGYSNVISEEEFKILIYLLCLSKNGIDISNNYNYSIDKIFFDIGYDTSVKSIINYEIGNEYLELIYDKYSLDIREHAYIYSNISRVIDILFSKYYDNYNFIKNKDLVLRYIYYLYSINISFRDKVFFSSNYKMLEFEWDSIRNKYLNI